MILREVIGNGTWVWRRAWEAGHDDARDLCSLSELIVSGWKRADDEAAGAMTTAASASVMSKVVEANLTRAATTHAPLVATVAAGRSVASVKVAGMMVSDFPNLVAEWDHERNEGDPAAIPAGRDVTLWWRCAQGHRWQAKLTMRTMRQTRCRECHRPWATATSSFAAVHPTLLPEWDSEQNLPRRPEQTLATSGKTAWWLCRDRPDIHAPYKVSPLARGKREIGCPICRRMARTGRKPAA